MLHKENGTTERIAVQGSCSHAACPQTTKCPSKHHPSLKIVETEENRSVYSEDNDSESYVEEDVQESWSNLTWTKKALRMLLNVFKFISVIILLYFFVCSLDLVSVGFRIIGGPEPQNLFKHDVLNNYVVGLMCGILFTILVQSSSTTTTAVVGLVAGKIIPLRAAIPIIMGSNIGTSVTNTLLAMTQVADRDKFRRAFAAATVHDMFNWLTTLILLPVECLTGYLYHTSRFVVQEIGITAKSNRPTNLKLLKALTGPLTKLIVQLDKKVTHQWDFFNDTTKPTKYQSAIAKEGHLFAGSNWSDVAIGATVVTLSLLSLLICLLLLVKILKSILKGKIALWIRKISNSNLPHCPKMTDYLLMLMGTVLTFLVQSSSAFTSTLPPLVSVKALTLERAYALTLGANIGTTTTAILAAFAQTDVRNFSEGLQIALCHLIFNVTGVLLFYPVPCTRFPIHMARSLGNTTAEYRWFAILYIVVLFILLPLMFMGLAFAGSDYVIAVAIFLVLGFLFIIIVNSLKKYPRFLPKFLHSWKCLPEWLRSLEPYDRLFVKCGCCRRLLKLSKSNEQGMVGEEKIQEQEAESSRGKSLKTVTLVEEK